MLIYLLNSGQNYCVQSLCEYNQKRSSALQRTMYMHIHIYLFRAVLCTQFSTGMLLVNKSWKKVKTYKFMQPTIM